MGGLTREILRLTLITTLRRHENGIYVCLVREKTAEEKPLVRERGLEPPPLAGPDPKSGVSAISPLAQP